MKQNVGCRFIQERNILESYSTSYALRYTFASFFILKTKQALTQRSIKQKETPPSFRLKWDPNTIDNICPPIREAEA